MKNKIYSITLVSLQFILIAVLLLLNASIFNSLISSIISFIGFFIGLYSLSYNKINNFNIRPELKSGAKLITVGPYKYIRHPMYLSVVLIMFGVLFVDKTLISLFLYLGLIFVLYLKAKKEEMLLSKHFQEYKEYKSKTKMFIPFIL